ncbi:MAG: hypothetical protein HQL40_02995 [Alphaproteobacteria bacterium]|nr:hypothetical protein [Alphaproteobacteria bacterium]
MTGIRRGSRAAAVLAAVLLAAPAALAIEASVPTAGQNKPSDPDIWRAIKDGAIGQPGETGADGRLIKPPVAGCSDKVVGFTTASVNAYVPPVGLPQGQGPTIEAMGLLAAIFGAAAGVAAMLARNLGKHPQA